MARNSASEAGWPFAFTVTSASDFSSFWNSAADLLAKVSGSGPKSLIGWPLTMVFGLFNASGSSKLEKPRFGGAFSTKATMGRSLWTAFSIYGALPAFHIMSCSAPAVFLP